MAVIYRATNLDNWFSFIGYAKDFNKRLGEHKRYINQPTLKYFHSALQKYGWDNFRWEILYQSDDDEYTYKVMEPKLIRENHTYWKEGRGYNLTYGGDGTGHIVTEETKAKISAAHKGKVVSQEVLDVLRRNARMMKGIPIPEERRLKISRSHKGKVLTMAHRHNIGESNKLKSFYKDPEYRAKMSLAKRKKNV